MCTCAHVYAVGKWSARDKSVEEIVEHIRNTKKRPLVVKFLVSTSPGHCRMADDGEAQEQQAGAITQDTKQGTATQETCTIDEATGTCAKPDAGEMRLLCCLVCAHAVTVQDIVLRAYVCTCACMCMWVCVWVSLSLSLSVCVCVC